MTAVLPGMALLLDFLLQLGHYVWACAAQYYDLGSAEVNMACIVRCKIWQCAIYSQGGVKFPTGGNSCQGKARERLYIVQGQQIW